MIEDQKRILSRVLYSQIIMECGVDGSRFCILEEYMQPARHPNYKIPDAVISKFNDVDQAKRSCYAVPFIGSNPDGTPFSDFVNLICEQSEVNFKKFSEFMLMLSFIVDKYKIWLSQNPLLTENGYGIIRGVGY